MAKSCQKMAGKKAQTFFFEMKHVCKKIQAILHGSTFYADDLITCEHFCGKLVQFPRKINYLSAQRESNWCLKKNLNFISFIQNPNLHDVRKILAGGDQLRNLNACASENF